MKTKAIIIIEPISRSKDYVAVAIKHGYLPIVLRINHENWDPHYEIMNKSTYEKSVSEVDVYLKQFKHTLIKEPKNFQDLLKTLDDYSIHAVIPCSDIAIKLADKLASALNLPNNDPNLSETRINKFLVNKTLEDNKLRSIRSLVITPRTKHFEIRRFFKKSKYPLFIKPVLGVYSHDAYKVENKAELKSITKKLFSKKIVENLPRYDKLLLQEFIGGDEYAVNFVSVNGRHILTDIYWLEKQLIDGKYFCKKIDLIKDLKLKHQRIVQYGIDVLNATKFKWGSSNLEIKYYNDEAVLIEINNRVMGFDFHSKLNDAIGLDLLEMSLLSYIQPDKVLEYCIDKYRPTKNYNTLYLSQPENQSFSNFPIHHIIKKLKTLVEDGVVDKTNFDYQKTNDQESSLGYLSFAGSKEEAERDEQLVLEIEKNNFNLLFQTSKPKIVKEEEFVEEDWEELERKFVGQKVLLLSNEDNLKVLERSRISTITELKRIKKVKSYSALIIDTKAIPKSIEAIYDDIDWMDKNLANNCKIVLTHKTLSNSVDGVEYLFLLNNYLPIIGRDAKFRAFNFFVKNN